MKISYLSTFALLLSLASCGECQTVGQGNDNGFFGGWFERMNHALATQPHWLAPIFTPTARLEEMFVYDISRQNTAKGNLTSFGGTKGLLLIPGEHINIVITPPSYLMHESRTIHNGFGDASFLLKYRLAASNEEHTNYVVTAFLGATIPTGSYTNGARMRWLHRPLGWEKAGAISTSKAQWEWRSQWQMWIHLGRQFSTTLRSNTELPKSCGPN